MSIERLPLRRPIGSLTSPLEVFRKLLHRIGMDGSKRLARVADTKVVNPSRLPSVDISYHWDDRHKTAAWSGEVADRAFAKALRLGKMLRYRCLPPLKS